MEMVFNVAIGALLLTFLVGGTAISPETVASDLLGSSGVPMLFAGIGLVLLGFSVFEGRKTKDASKKQEAADPAGVKKALAVMAALLAYIIVLPYCGFAIGTTGLAYASVRIIGYRKRLKSLLFSFILTAVLVVVFGRVFFIALPRGIGLIKEISYFLY